MRIVALLIAITLLFACDREDSQEALDKQVVQQQQAQYAKGQPIPMYNWSLERDLLIQLYNIRNERVATHSVWRSDYGMIEGDCPSIGYGLPYDTSLTNPKQAMWRYRSSGSSGVALDQAEPNGIFASKNTAATWVMCVGKAGTIEPHYVETKVSVYPGPVEVDYETNRVVRAGEATVTMSQNSSP